MPIVEDKGNCRSQFNSWLGDFVANVFGQRMNYTLRYFSHRHHLPNFNNPKDLSERMLSAMLSKEFLKYADYADKVKVRGYVESRGFSNILLKQYGTVCQCGTVLLLDYKRKLNAHLFAILSEKR